MTKISAYVCTLRYKRSNFGLSHYILAMFEKITEYMAYKGPLLCTPLGNGRYEKRYKRAESQRRSGPYSPSYLEFTFSETRPL
jgi:hypothetical protein